MASRDGTRQFDVCIVGCGHMGSALAKGAAGAGLHVAAWNRTFARAERLATSGITPIEDLRVAIESSAAVIVCLASYGNIDEAFEVIDGWEGQVVINVTSGTPQESDELADRLSGQDVDYLDGCILSYPKVIGTPQALFFCSGLRSAWERCSDLLQILGTAHFVEGTSGLNSLLLQGMSAFYISALSAVVEAATYLAAYDLPAGAAEVTADGMLAMIKDATREAIPAIKGGTYETQQATIDIYAEGAHHVLASFQSDGVSAPILEAASSTLDLARASGLGHLGYYAQAHLLRGSGGTTS
jgi:3-hydroxyisobutyrate dehydrogenase-like beta-hydroxyacid dehydrogenase